MELQTVFMTRDSSRGGRYLKGQEACRDVNDTGGMSVVGTPRVEVSEGARLLSCL